MTSEEEEITDRPARRGAPERNAWIVLAISLGPAAAILALIASNQR